MSENNIFTNPYNPGAGSSPKYLAGREKEIEAVSVMFEALKRGISQRSVIYYGLRGVGKTVLLNEFENICDQKAIYYQHIEITDSLRFIPAITTAANRFLRNLSSKEKLKNYINKVLDAIKTLTISFSPGDVTFQITPEEKEMYYSADYEQSFTELFESLGSIAKESDQPICFFIDEIQYMRKEDISALICALHRVSQKGYPLMLIGAGLPKVFQFIGNARTYAERIFRYEEIDSLTDDEARDAIVVPAEEEGKKYEPAAIDEIIRATGSYPYFIQEFCYQVWNNADGDTITLKDVKGSEKQYIETLDNGFFMVRFERCTDREKNFMYAMVDCGELPCTISNVAKNMKKQVTQISPIRAQLINKGLIYAAKYGEIDFTVPKFDEFLIRKRE